MFLCIYILICISITFVFVFEFEFGRRSALCTLCSACRYVLITVQLNIPAPGLLLARWHHRYSPDAYTNTHRNRNTNTHRIANFYLFQSKEIYIFMCTVSIAHLYIKFWEAHLHHHDEVVQYQSKNLLLYFFQRKYISMHSMHCTALCLVSICVKLTYSDQGK